MDNILEIHDGNFHLTIYLDKLHELPIPNYRKLLRKYPDAVEPLGAYLRERVSICKAVLAEDKQSAQNLKKKAERLYKAYNRLLQIYENQGGTHK